VEGTVLFQNLEKNCISGLKMPWNAGARSAATSRTATSASRRTCRTRVGRTRRGTRVTTGRCAATAGAPP
jgi:hypothetical protein